MPLRGSQLNSPSMELIARPSIPALLGTVILVVFVAAMPFSANARKAIGVFLALVLIPAAIGSGLDPTVRFLLSVAIALTLAAFIYEHRATLHSSYYQYSLSVPIVLILGLPVAVVVWLWFSRPPLAWEGILLPGLPLLAAGGSYLAGELARIRAQEREELAKIQEEERREREEAERERRQIAEEEAEERARARRKELEERRRCEEAERAERKARERERKVRERQEIEERAAAERRREREFRVAVAEAAEADTVRLAWQSSSRRTRRRSRLCIASRVASRRRR